MADAIDDNDAKLHKASTSLLAQLSTSLTNLCQSENALQKNKPSTCAPRLWVREAETLKITQCLEPFQAWPQLLDPHLASFLPPIIELFLTYMRSDRQSYTSDVKGDHSSGLLPLPRSLCRILYVFCKVRGTKVIQRFFNNEARYLELVLKAFFLWEGNTSIDDDQEKQQPPLGYMEWEERYIMLLWLSHLLLAPFDLKSIASNEVLGSEETALQLPSLPSKTPQIAKSIVVLSFKYLIVPGKEREAASTLLARLTLRPDMQRVGMLDCMVKWALSLFQVSLQREPPPVYTSIGVMSFVARLTGSGQAHELAAFIAPIFKTFCSMAQSEEPFAVGVTTSASSRKLIIKILRSALVLGLSLEDNTIPGDALSAMLEDAIDYLLTSLADQDTPVRFAASKALSVITLNLDPVMGEEVVEAVIGSLTENVLWEDKTNPLSQFNTEKPEIQIARPNLSAVNALRWQGLMLTLAQLLFRRSPPAHQLPDILKSLTSGIVFEQRLSTGTSLGIGVRDAANFGLWSVSRKYSTEEFLNVDVSQFEQSKLMNISSCQQLIAAELVAAACLDPSGNIRRGSSAALQELIGRHPDVIIEGIPVVQVVDYHAVALRSRAMIDVAENAAKLDRTYWSCILDGLLSWRGLCAPDAESRRTAAVSLGKLSALRSFEGLVPILKHLAARISVLPPQSVEERHGYLLGLAASVEVLSEAIKDDRCDAPNSLLQSVSRLLPSMWAVFEQFIRPNRKDLVSPTLRPQLTAESCSRLIAAMSTLCDLAHMKLAVRSPSESALNDVLKVLLLCLSRNEEMVVQASSLAASGIFTILDDDKRRMLVRTWLQDLRSEVSAVGREGRRGFGHVAALGAVYGGLCSSSGDDEIRDEVYDELLACIGIEKQLELRISALQSLKCGVLGMQALDARSVEVIERSLNDYTTDQRGDVGSLLRLEALDCVAKIVHELDEDLPPPDHVNCMVIPVVRLAAEKLDKVRFKAWRCLQNVWDKSPDFPSRWRNFSYLSEVSTFDYFSQILLLTGVESLRTSLLQGYATCAGGGTETTVRACRQALTAFISTHRDRTVPRQIFHSLLQVLRTQSQDDRYAVPTLEVLSFILDSGVMVSLPSSKTTASYRDDSDDDERGPPPSTAPDEHQLLQRCFVLVQKAHYKSSSIPKLEAAVKTYAGLLNFGRERELQGKVADKLVGMLLHPYPRVRSAVVEALWMHFEIDVVRDEDWTASTKGLKSKVSGLRDMVASSSVDWKN